MENNVIMKQWMLCLVLILLGSMSAFAVDASVSYATFKSSKTPYVELYIYVLGNSVTFEKVKGADQQLQAALEVLVLIKQGDQIIQYDKSLLNSPITSKAVDFTDVKRMAVPAGTYTIEVEIVDKFFEENQLVLSEQLVVQFEGDIMLSDIQMLAAFKDSKEENALVKNGIQMDPIPYHFYNKKFMTLPFYLEVYQPESTGGNYIVCYQIYKIQSNGTREERFKQYKRRTSKETDAILYQLDISKLESADYVLRVSVVNAQQEEIVSKEATFVRANPEYDYLKSVEFFANIGGTDDRFTDKLDSIELRYSLRALVPVISQRDAEVLKIVIAKGELNAMRMFLFNHFESQFPENPGFAYKKYMDVARAVDKKYENGFGYGFEADRGFYFLKYGKPDDIREVEDEPSAPPYEIWFYNKIIATNQNNVRFVFYNPSLIKNGHILLHSTARGEWNNPKWEAVLYSKSNSDIQGGNPVDGNEVRDNFGHQARRLYNDF
jgi:GWxTD domain-containing protein